MSYVKSHIESRLCSPGYVVCEITDFRVQAMSSFRVHAIVVQTMVWHRLLGSKWNDPLPKCIGNFHLIYYGVWTMSIIAVMDTVQDTSMVQLVALPTCIETQRSRVRIPDKSRFFPHVKKVEDIGLTNRPRKRSKFV
jgi:hypothetical protein